MRGKRKEGKAQKDKSTVYKDPVKHNALTKSHPRHKTTVRSASLGDERHLCFVIFLWKTYRMTVFVPGSIANNILKPSFPRSDPFR